MPPKYGYAAGIGHGVRREEQQRRNRHAKAKAYGNNVQKIYSGKENLPRSGDYQCEVCGEVNSAVVIDWLTHSRRERHAEPMRQ